MSATLHKGYSGGPPGSATSLYVESGPANLVQILTPPKAPPGSIAILPGQRVYKALAVGELAHLDDRYVIELPKGAKVNVWIEPSEIVFGPEVRTEREQLAVEHDKAMHTFTSQGAGLYEIRILAAQPLAGAQMATLSKCIGGKTS